MPDGKIKDKRIKIKVKRILNKGEEERFK